MRLQRAQGGPTLDSSHNSALQAFARRIALTLMLRGALHWTAAWLFLWGLVILIARISHSLPRTSLAAGLLAFLAPASIGAWIAWKRAPSRTVLRAAYDLFNRCGGLVMSSEIADVSAWTGMLPAASRPRLRWRKGRSLGLLALAILFSAGSLFLPERIAALASKPPLQIGQLVGELQAEVKVLENEKILQKEKSEDLQSQLAQIKEQASSLDPNKTWEALDHIKEANQDLAHQAADEALNKMTSLTEAQALASALESASEAGLAQETATRAAQDLASLVNGAKLETGLLKGNIPAELLASPNLSREDLKKLLAAIAFNKAALNGAVTNLANLKLIDTTLLSKCRNAGNCPTPGALAEFLASCTNACDSFCDAAKSLCQSSTIRLGGSGAPMTWKEESSEQGLKFKEELLPPSDRLSGSVSIGVSRAAPQVAVQADAAEGGALNNAPGSGGSAFAQTILPRYRPAVQRFFKRDQ